VGSGQTWTDLFDAIPVAKRRGFPKLATTTDASLKKMQWPGEIPAKIAIM
jgi:hypothetical protein